MAKQIIKTMTKTDIVVSNVISMIADEHYKPGDKLPPEGYFIEAYGVSRVTVREAFSRLSSMGVVTIRQGDGTFVNAVKPFEIKAALFPLLTVDEKSISDVYETRICIEQFIIELAVLRKTEETLSALRDLTEKMASCLAEGAAERYSELDHAFHDYLSDMCGNAIIQSIYDSLSALRRQGIRSSNTDAETMQRSQQDHVDMLLAIETGQADTAKKIMRRHLLRSKELLLAGKRDGRTG